MKGPCAAKILPDFLASPLFGDRKRFGLIPDKKDPDWAEWQRIYLDFYYANQKRSVGAFVNNAGYRVLKGLDLEGKRVLEIGPGHIQHLPYWRGRPAHFEIADVDGRMLEASSSVLEREGVNFGRKLLVPRDPVLPYADASFDLVLSFYSLEHLFPLGDYLGEMIRVLKPGGFLAGAIPAEGGLAWGLGRFLTSRRWFKKNSSVNPDKIICWEHPNFAPDILEALDARLRRKAVSTWPWGLPLVDFNLIIRFVHEKR